MTTAKLRKRASDKPATASHKPATLAKTVPERASLLPRSTLAEHLHRIENLGKRIDAYVHFMATMNEHSGLSEEMKTRAAIEFYEKLLVVEEQLARIHDAYQLE